MKSPSSQQTFPEPGFRHRFYRNLGRLSVYALLIGIGIIYTWGTWRYFTQPVPGGNDFLAHYSVWQAYFKYGYSPYSEEAALYTQQAIRGRPALPGEDQNRLTYPYYSIVIHGPFVLIDYAVARAIYMTLLQVALFAGVLLSQKLFRWRPPTWLLAVTLIWSLVYYPEARGVILGQFAIFGFFSLACALYFLEQKRDVLAGAVLVLSTVKPTLVFLVVPFLLLWGVVKRRWGFIWSFLSILGILIIGSFIALPTWLSEWLLRMERYSGYTVGQSPVWLLTRQVFPALGMAGEIVIVSLLLAGMLWTWWQAFHPSGETVFYWALGITLVVSNLIVPRSATTNYVLMLIPTIWVFAALDRLSKWGRAVLLICLLCSFAGLWWLHIATVVGNQEQPIMFIPYPVSLGMVLLFGYRWLLKDAQRLRLAL